MIDCFLEGWYFLIRNIRKTNISKFLFSFKIMKLEYSAPEPPLWVVTFLWCSKSFVRSHIELEGPQDKYAGIIESPQGCQLPDNLFMPTTYLCV